MSHGNIMYDRGQNVLVINAPFEHNPRCSGLRSRVWIDAAKCWLVPVSLANVEEVMARFDDYSLDPAIHTLLQKLRGRNTIFQSIKERLDITPEQASYNWVTTPRKYQVAGTMAMLQRERVMLNDQMGLGKTKQVIDACGYRLDQAITSRTVVICPSSLKWNWVDEIEIHAPKEYQDYIVIQGTPKQRAKQFRKALDYGVHWVLLNYELARLNQDNISELVMGNTLVLDEAHRIKNPSAQVTKAIGALSPEFLILMTGTPVANRPEDIWALAHFVEPGILGMNFRQFKKRYCKEAEKIQESGRKSSFIVGYRNLADLQARISTIAIRRTKAQVLPELPAKVFEHRHAFLEGDQKREYKRMKEELIAEYKEMPERDFKLKAVNAHTQLLRLQQIADGFLKVGERRAQWFDNNQKLSELDDIVDEVVANSGEKLVIWSRFLAVTEMLTERYAEHGTERIFGDIKPAERFDIVDRFQKKDTPRILVVQVHSGGLGFNMTAAQTTVFYDRWWSVSVNEQAEDRLHRLGQKGTVTVVTLITKDSVDERMMNMLKHKQEWANVITGDDIKLTKKSMLYLLGEEQ